MMKHSYERAIKAVLSRYFENPETVWKEIVSETLTEDDLMRFDARLNLHRRKLKHVKITSALKASTLQTAKEVVEAVNTFANDYNLSGKKALNIYIKYGLKLIGNNYRLNKFLYLDDKIRTEYVKNYQVETDEDKELTKRVFSYYQSLAGIPCDLTVDFLYTAQVIKKHNFDVKEFLNAQVDRMKSFGIFPEPYNLHTDSAINYMYGRMKGKSKKPKNVLDKLLGN